MISTIRRLVQLKNEIKHYIYIYEFNIVSNILKYKRLNELVLLIETRETTFYKI